MASSDLLSELEIRKQILLIDEQILRNRLTSATLSASQREEINAAIASTNAYNVELGNTRDRAAQASRSIADLSSQSSGIAGLGEKFKLAAEAAGLFIDPILEASSRLEAMSADRRDVVTKIAEELGGSSRLFTLFATDATTAANQIESVGQNALGKLKDHYDILGDSAASSLKQLNEEQANFISDGIRSDQVYLRTQATMTQLYARVAGFKQDPATGQLVSDSFFRVQGVPFMDVMGGVMNSFEPFMAVLRDENLRTPFARDMLDPDDIDKSVVKLTDVGVAIKALGMTSETFKETIRQNFIRTGQATTDLFDTVVKASMMGQYAFGINANLIASDINKMMKDSDMFGFRTADDFAKISASIHDVQMNVDQLKTVMSKFDTFESASSAVGMLNSTLGANFDAMELLAARYSDPVKFISLLREGLNSTGKEFAELPLAFQNVVTKALSLEADVIVGIQKNKIRTNEELTAAQEKINEKYAGQKDAEALLREDLEKKVNLTKEMTKNVGDMSDQAERAIVMIKNVGLELSETAIRSQEQLNKMTNNLVGQVSSTYKSVVDAITMGDKMLVDKGLQVADEVIKSKLPKQIGDITSTVITQYVKVLEASLSGLEEKQRKAAIAEIESAMRNAARRSRGTTEVEPTQTEDIVVKGSLNEGERVILAQYGQLSAYKVDARDDVKAAPPAEVKSAPAPAPEPTVRPAPISTLPNAVQASLQGVGTSLRIELDIGQLTDMILRDIMMNKSAVFGGVGG